ncbi:MAG: HAD family phosphatase [Clostridia bacterium]|nr:HAD family phosphatase [Clostridia bacterium]
MEAKQRTYSLIAFDMDGTLLDSEKQLHGPVLEAIALALAKGKRVALATGRTRSELEPYRTALDAVPLGILASGAILYDFRAERTLWRATFTAEQLACLERAAQQEDALILVKRDAGLLLEEDALQRWSRNENAKEAALFWSNADYTRDLRAYLRSGPLGVEKVNLCHASAEARARTKKRLEGSGFETAESNRAVLEVSPPGVDKGSALLRLCELVGVRPEESIAVGDADNDLPMLRAAGLGIAMGNAAPAVKAAAGAAVSDCDHDGCKEAIRRYLLSIDE